MIRFLAPYFLIGCALATLILSLTNCGSVVATEPGFPLDAVMQRGGVDYWTDGPDTSVPTHSPDAVLDNAIPDGAPTEPAPNMDVDIAPADGEAGTTPKDATPERNCPSYLRCSVTSQECAALGQCVSEQGL